ncbi:MAG: RHS repeat domain-containing protein [Thermodesulfobacteriota bacterium]
MKVGLEYYFYHNDHLGTPQKMTTISGAVVWSAKYSSFGKAEIDPASTVTNNLRFPGQMFDGETGLHYNWFRYYDPSIGRYLSPDPIKFAGGLNLYQYVGGDPINYTDSIGLLVKPGSDKHRQRNRHNKCPKIRPTQTKAIVVSMDGKCKREEWIWIDHEGNEWNEDWFGNNITHKGNGYTSFRRPDPDNPGSSFQCTYDKDGNFVPDEGNYDYANPDEQFIRHLTDDVYPGLLDSNYESPDPTTRY